MHTTREELSALKMLTARSHFLDVQKAQKKWISKSLVLQIRPNNLDVIRIGFTVTKRVDKSAVRRNRIKRRLRSACADILSQYAKPGYDYVLVGRRETLTIEYKKITGDLKWCLKRLDLLKK